MKAGEAGTFFLLLMLTGVLGCATRGQVRQQVSALDEEKQGNLERLEERLESLTAALDREAEVLREREERVAAARSQALMASDSSRRAEAQVTGQLLGETVFRVEGLRFEPASAVLTSESRALLDQLAERLRVENAGYFLEIQARGWSGGDAASLEAARADAVRRYLHQGHGLPLHAVGTIIAPDIAAAADELSSRAAGDGDALLEVEEDVEPPVVILVIRPLARP